MRPVQHEIDAMIQAAMEAKMRCGYTDAAAVNITRLSRSRFTLGFNFHAGARVGDVYSNDDGTRCEVVALV